MSGNKLTGVKLTGPIDRRAVSYPITKKSTACCVRELEKVRAVLQKMYDDQQRCRERGTRDSATTGGALWALDLSMEAIDTEIERLKNE